MKSGLSTLSAAIVGSARQARIACEIFFPLEVLPKGCLASEARQANGKAPVVKVAPQWCMWSTLQGLSICAA